MLTILGRRSERRSKSSPSLVKAPDEGAPFTAVGSEEARFGAGLRPQLKLHVQVSRIELSRRFSVAGMPEKVLDRASEQADTRRKAHRRGPIPTLTGYKTRSSDRRPCDPEFAGTRSLPLLRRLEKKGFLANINRQVTRSARSCAKLVRSSGLNQGNCFLRIVPLSAR